MSDEQTEEQLEEQPEQPEQQPEQPEKRPVRRRRNAEIVISLPRNNAMGVGIVFGSGAAIFIFFLGAIFGGFVMSMAVKMDAIRAESVQYIPVVVTAPPPAPTPEPSPTMLTNRPRRYPPGKIAPAFVEPTRLPAPYYPAVPPLVPGQSYTGTASQYASWETTQATIEWNTQYGHLPPDILGQYNVYTAVYHCDQVGLEMLIRPLGRAGWERAIAVDCSNQVAYPWEAWLFAPPPEGEGWLVEIDSLTAERWGVVGRGVVVEVVVIGGVNE